jgi:hypothetical protein
MTMPVFEEDEILYKDVITVDMVNLGHVAAIEYNDIPLFQLSRKRLCQVSN